MLTELAVSMLEMVVKMGFLQIWWRGVQLRAGRPISRANIEQMRSVGCNRAMSDLLPIRLKRLLRGLFVQQLDSRIWRSFSYKLSFSVVLDFSGTSCETRI
jgi:hypothetical protein